MIPAPKPKHKPVAETILAAGCLLLAFLRFRHLRDKTELLTLLALGLAISARVLTGRHPRPRTSTGGAGPGRPPGP